MGLTLAASALVVFSWWLWWPWLGYSLGLVCCGLVSLSDGGLIHGSIGRGGLTLICLTLIGLDVPR